MKKLGTAKTLGELIPLIQKAIQEYGLNAQWSGWDDGSIIIDIISKDGRWEEQAFIENKKN